MVSAATPLARASTLAGRPVITEGGDAGLEVQDLVLDDDGRTIAGFTLREQGVFGKRHVAVVPMASVQAIGPDAVMIPDREALRTDEREPAVCADVLHSRVVTEVGVEVGEITDVVVETARNQVRIEAIEIDAADGTRYLVLGEKPVLDGEVVVVPTGSERRLDETPEQVADHLGIRA